MTYRTLLVAGLLACGPVSSVPSPVPDAGTGLPPNCRTLHPGAVDYLACTGVFASGQASSLCPAGYRLASGPMPTSIQEACQNDASIIANNIAYAADVGQWTNPQTPLSGASCTSVQGWPTALMICGGVQNATVQTVCQGWPRGLLCSKTSDWTCPNASLATATNTNPKHGVICSR